MAPNKLCPLLGILVPRRLEQPLELTQIYVAENVGRAGLPGPPVGQSPKRGRPRHHGGRGGGRSGIHLWRKTGAGEGRSTSFINHLVNSPNSLILLKEVSEQPHVKAY